MPAGRSRCAALTAGQTGTPTRVAVALRALAAAGARRGETLMFGWCREPRAAWRIEDFARIPYRLPPEPPKMVTRVCKACSDACRDVMQREAMARHAERNRARRAT